MRVITVICLLLVIAGCKAALPPDIDYLSAKQRAYQVARITFSFATPEEEKKLAAGLKKQFLDWRFEWPGEGAPLALEVRIEKFSDTDLVVRKNELRYSMQLTNMAGVLLYWRVMQERSDAGTGLLDFLSFGRTSRKINAEEVDGLVTKMVSRIVGDLSDKNIRISQDAVIR